MSFSDIPLLQMIKGRMGYVTARQRLISENVANADTPHYAPRDLTPFSFAQVLKPRLDGLTRTDPAHIAAGGRNADAATPFKTALAPDSESRLDGNQVVLEEQMAKMSAARIDFEAAIDSYQSSMNMISTAARAPGE